MFSGCLLPLHSRKKYPCLWKNTSIGQEHKHWPENWPDLSQVAGHSCRNSSLSSHGARLSWRKSLITQSQRFSSPSWGSWPWFHSSALWPTSHGLFCPGHVCVVCVWVCALKMLIDEMIPHIIMWVYVSNISIAHTPNHTSHTLPSQSPQCGLTTSTLMSYSCSSSSRSNRSTCHGRSSASAWHIRCASASASQGSTVSTVHTETSSVERSACSAARQTKVEGDSAMQVAFYLRHSAAGQTIGGSES